MLIQYIVICVLTFLGRVDQRVRQSSSSGERPTRLDRQWRIRTQLGPGRPRGVSQRCQPGPPGMRGRGTHYPHPQ